MCQRLFSLREIIGPARHGRRTFPRMECEALCRQERRVTAAGLCLQALSVPSALLWNEPFRCRWLAFRFHPLLLIDVQDSVNFQAHRRPF